MLGLRRRREPLPQRSPLFLRISPQNSFNFYRVKALCANQQVFLSKTVMVNGVEPISQIQVVPNPILNQNIQLLIANLNSGIYDFELRNTIGQMITKGSFPVFTTTHKINLPIQKRLSSGIYNLIIKIPEKQLKNLQVIIN
jgi:hypothetical protein